MESTMLTNWKKTVALYKGDFDKFCLEAQLKLLPSIAQNAGYQVGKIDICDALQPRTQAQITKTRHTTVFLYRSVAKLSEHAGVLGEDATGKGSAWQNLFDK
jgi:hypothetical protein